MPFRKGPIPKSLKCFIHNPAYMQQSIMLNLRECKTADKDAYWFLLAVSLFSPISNENLPRLKQLNIERSEFFKALNKANSSCWLDKNTYTAR